MALQITFDDLFRLMGYTFQYRVIAVRVDITGEPLKMDMSLAQ